MAQAALEEKSLKRPRFACKQCQRSKLKCDHGHPCGSCAKRDQARACTYRELATVRDEINLQRPKGSRIEIDAQNTIEPLTTDSVDSLRVMVQQLMQKQVFPISRNLSSFTDPLGTLQSSEIQDPSIPESSDQPSESMKYVGSTHWSAILDDIQELKLSLGASSRLQDEEDPVTIRLSSYSGELIFGSQNDYSLQFIISQYLPPRVEVDRLLSVYFNGETYIVPFIHTYHFQRQYRDFWNKIDKVNPLWLSMLFSICYMSSVIGGSNNPFQTSKDDLLSGCSILHTAAGQCLVFGQYHRPQKFAPEALALYAHCKCLQSLDLSREAGAILGVVVRMAYEMGYHRDPDTHGSHTVFEGEMRRRFWATCKQIDLMVSFQLGLPSHISPKFCDTHSPRNLLDSDFDTNTTSLPNARMENETTKMLWFIVKERQMACFSKVCQYALSFREKSEAQVLQLDMEIHAMHTTIPDILRARPFSESIADSSFLIMTRLYIEFIHLKSLCVLHRNGMARGNAFSSTSCINAGEALVRVFIDMYDEFLPGGQLSAERWMLSSFIMNDFLLGCIVLCLVLHTSWKESMRNPVIDIEAEYRIISLLERSLQICLEKSTESKEALRVFHAIRLTLNRATSSRLSLADLTNTREISSFEVAQTSSERQVIDSATLMMPPWYGYIQGDEEGFEVWGPFNSLDSDIENIDWNMFNPPV